MDFDGYSELLKTAPKRLKDARELLESPTFEADASDAGIRHLRTACYLAGYAVECILKVYGIMVLDARSGSHVQRWDEVIKHWSAQAPPLKLEGKHSHDLNKLRTAAGLEGEMDGDETAKQNWGICKKWDYNQRYNPRPLEQRQRAVEFVEACEALYLWVRPRIPFAG